MPEQRTADWFNARAGKATASKIADIVRTVGKDKPAASRKNYLADLVLERFAGPTSDAFCSPAMQHGIDMEPVARAAYEQHALVAVTEVGFIDHPTIAMSGASPDGLVGDNGLVEIKCPNQATHLDTLRNRTVKPDYIVQMQWQMACAGRQWCDFVSFDDRFPPEMQLFVTRFERDDERIAELEEAVAKFLAEVDEAVADLRANYQTKKAA